VGRTVSDRVDRIAAELGAILDYSFASLNQGAPASPDCSVMVSSLEGNSIRVG